MMGVEGSPVQIVAIAQPQGLPNLDTQALAQFLAALGTFLAMQLQNVVALTVAKPIQIRFLGIGHHQDPKAGWSGCFSRQKQLGPPLRRHKPRRRLHSDHSNRRHTHARDGGSLVRLSQAADFQQGQASLAKMATFISLAMTLPARSQ